MSPADFAVCVARLCVEAVASAAGFPAAGELATEAVDAGLPSDVEVSLSSTPSARVTELTGADFSSPVNMLPETVPALAVVAAVALGFALARAEWERPGTGRGIGTAPVGKSTEASAAGEEALLPVRLAMEGSVGKDDEAEATSVMLPFGGLTWSGMVPGAS